MKVYIDFDDVICETAKYFSYLVKELFEKDVPYAQVQFFNLQKSYDLTDEQYDELMKAGHLPENLLSFEETPGASETINRWIDEGYEVSVITGRPFIAYEPSREWLDKHGLERLPLYCVDKYGREKFYSDKSYNISLEKFYKMTFDFAVEDSPIAFEHLLHFENCEVAVFNRPWNTRENLPNGKFTRCSGWADIDRLLKEIK